MLRFSLMKLAAAAVLVAGSAAAAQVGTVDPNDAYAQETTPAPVQQQAEQAPADSEWVAADPGPQGAASTTAAQAEAPLPASDASSRASAASKETVDYNNVFSAAEGVFGKGAEGLADLLENILRKQGEPSAYITGREAGGAVVVGVRYGSGTLHHKVEGDRPIYWTGPSLGLDFGADATKVFVLVYNLHDAERIFKRYGAAEGNAFVIGGFTASYLRRGDIVLIPVRLGVGARLGVNAGYMRFSQKSRWLPF
ncbi:MAG TPA: DUF1134 domain-containing protein [Allosphingosinicella sp.]|jgi:hypothetical protein